MGIGTNPICKNRIQPEYGDEQINAGRDCGTHFVRPNCQARTRAGNFPCSDDHEQDWQPSPVDLYGSIVCALY